MKRLKRGLSLDTFDVINIRVSNSVGIERTATQLVRRGFAHKKQRRSNRRNVGSAAMYYRVI